MKLLPLLLLGVLAHSAGRADSFVQTNAFPAAEANQAAAADDRFLYAIDSKVIAKYDRSSGQRIAVSTGEASHLNSGAFWEGRLYCAHSNFPKKPEKSEVRVLDPATMALSVSKDLGAGHGSLTWVVREGDTWWCTFAHYGPDNAKTTLVKYDAEWRELGSWTYPPAVIVRLGKMSISGGLWKDGLLLATGHDAREIYRLRLPKTGLVLELIDILPSPFPGQGIALDPGTKGLIGIDRKQRKIVLAELKP
jgi:hypothetical protein